MKYTKTLITIDIDFRNPLKMTDEELKKEICKHFCIMYLEGKIDITDVISDSAYINIDEDMMSFVKGKKLH